MKKLINKKNIVYAAVALLALVIVYFVYTKYAMSAVETPEQQAAKAQEQKEEIIAKVRALTVLPEEEPVIFTVNDASLLKTQQAFFKDAENGDVLFVFQKDSKALIFRESTNQIVNAGPISFQQPAAN